MNYTSGILLLLLITVVVFSSVMGPSMWKWAMGLTSDNSNPEEEGFQSESQAQTKLTETDIQKTSQDVGTKLAEGKSNQIETHLKSTASVSQDGELSKHPIPWERFEKKTMETDKTQDKHIEDIRRVLSTTISTLVQDDVLPAGTSQNCDAMPVVNSATGQVDPADGCRPPGWLRMMNARNERNGMPF